MMRSLYSGVSGLTTHQTRMDVIGNNIANVNTYGFKASRVTFRDIYYQTSIGETAGRNTYAGNNPAQVGYGVQLGSIDKDMSMSNFQNSNRVFDMAIAGDGFFMTATFDSLNLNSDKQASSVNYTRMGAFGIDSFGNLAASNNVLVVGSRNTLDGLSKNGDESLAAMNDVEVLDRNDDGKVNASDVTYRNVVNLNDLMQQAYNIYTDSAGYMYGIDWEALIDADTTGAIVVYDEELLTKDGKKLDDLATAKDKMKYVDIQATVDNINKEIADTTANRTPTVSGKALYYCDKTGKAITKADGTNVAYMANPDDTNQTTLETSGVLKGKLSYGDAEAVSVGKDGVITVTYNSEMKTLARVEIGVFDNPDGLAEDGDTQFSETVASGEVKIKRAGIDPGVTKTQIRSNFLEMSNVNLAQEFSDMIVTQRGFQANARIITTSDSMLEELVNLKR